VIGWLRGILRDRQASAITLDVQGVGYLVRIPASTFLELPAEGETIELLVSTQVREDSITLHGFRTRFERDLFDRLLSVSGVGPRTALAALSALGPEELAHAIASRNATRLSTVPGIGKKTAERIVVDLEDKIAAMRPAGEPSAPGARGPEADVLSALVNLGYADKQAARAITESARAGHASFDALLRDALKRLGKG
jgi:Holliday junction DNA helicase RuvA